MAVKKRSFDESEVLKNLNKEIIKIKGRTKKGITKALTEIMALSKERTPVDTGQLRRNTYIETRAGAKGPIGKAGYLQNYAVYVHENLESKHTVGQAKFMESAIGDKTKEVLKIIADNVKIK